MWDVVREFIKNWGGNESVAAIIGAILFWLTAQIGPALWAYLGRLTGWLWAMVSERGADRAFEKRYLDWLIEQHRHLGLLPAQVVARKWGERQKWVELEQIYVRLSMSSQAGDQHWGETYGKGALLELVE